MKASKVSDQIDRKKMHKVAFILFVMGLTLIFAHSMFLQSQQVQGDENWLISLDIQYTTQQDNSVISIQPPYESEYLRLVGRNLSHPGLRVVQPLRNSLNKRGIRIRSREAGNYQVGVEFILQLNQTPHFHNKNAQELSAKRRQFFLSDNEWLQLDHAALETLYTDIGFNQVKQDRLPENIFSYIRQLAAHQSHSLRNVPDILSTGSANNRERALLMVALCRKAGIPARVITGLELKDDPSAVTEYWAEAYVNGRWISYHPGLGYINNLPENFVALDKYGDGIVSVSLVGDDENLSSKNHLLEKNILVERTLDRFISPDNNRNEWYQIFVLDRLSADTREQLSLLMLLPLGALLCSLIRQFGGLHSYGVFTPTILALAVTYAEMETTLLILMITVLLVYFGRPAFHHKMARTPRLSIIFTLVAVSMVFGVSVLDNFSLAIDGQLILLPIVILTSLVDRFFSTVDTHSYRVALVRLVWTIILTVTVLPVLQLSWLGGWILRYPEFHFLTLSLLILISSYPFGKHKLPKSLSWLAEPQSKQKKSNVDSTALNEKG